ncbi:glycine zipper family protein [Herbaspirillum sp.]|uniref:glycine zipper family protein n=1 Tax=Herbaspirillum sp. TaxID=1890675 RepID=UPI001B261000|nr:glycine zipper family protein [Herbaspirillum sp.]MBO9538258.1 glycine zipper family protein [Herbaspirillum sp.]
MKTIYKTATAATAIGALLALGGCVSVPTGPSVMAMPGKGKSYEQFRADQAQCQQYAQDAIGGQAQQTQNSVTNSAAVGTAVGAVAGALVGAASGNAGAGAAIGAGGGLLVGSAAGSNAAAGGNYSMQQRYDMTYTQCMYSKGNQVESQRQVTTYTYYPRRYYYAPPPPPGYYGPPPVYYGPPPGAY